MNYAIILTGGQGTRLNSKLPKQFIKINDKELFLYTVKAFLDCNEISKIILVINPEYEQLYLDILNRERLLNKVSLVYGGSTRQQSVYNGLCSISQCASNDDIVLIHDGARPLVNNEIITNNINAVKENGKPASTIINIVDTIIDKAYNLINRDSLLSVQTPQTFMYDDIFTVHSKAIEDHITNASDDCQLAIKYGLQVQYVYGSRMNIKVTTSEDVEIVKSFLTNR